MTDEAVTWVPPMDVYEMDNNYVLDAELPGVERRDIKIEFSGLELTVRGERKLHAGCGDESYHRLEGHRGRFHRGRSHLQQSNLGQFHCRDCNGRRIPMYGQS